MVQGRWQMGFRMVLLALAYCVAGQVARWMAIPPGYATAFWPAAGIALAGVLLWGWQVFPGIAIGSMLVNIFTSFQAGTTADAFLSFLLPCIIGCGAAAQAVAGAAMVRRGIGLPNPLNRDKDIALLLALGGPVSCLINATVGTASLWAIDRIPDNVIAFHWWTWWIGDVIGVFLMTPVLLLWLGPRQEGWLRRLVTVAVPLIALAALVVSLFLYTDAREQGRLQDAFESQTEALAGALDHRVNQILEALYDLRGFHVGKPGPGDQARFSKQAQATLKRRPSVAALTWTPRIADSERTEFEQSCRRRAFPNYEIRELLSDGAKVAAQRRPEYFPILYREPAPVDPTTLGFDVASEPGRLEALSLAVDSGEPIASYPIPGRHDDSEKHILIFLPIYRGHDIPEQIKGRRQALLGYIIAVVQVRKLVDLAWQGLSSEGIDAWLLDVDAIPERRVALFRKSHDGTSDRRQPTVEVVPAFLQRDLSVNMAGRKWTARFTQTPEYTAAHRSLQPWGVLAGGMLFTGLLGSVLLGITGRNMLIAELVTQRTAELASANAAMRQEIRDRKQAEEALRAREESLMQSEERFRLLVEGTPDYAIFMLDPDGRVLSWNAGAQRIKGYTAAEIIGKPMSTFYTEEEIRAGNPGKSLEVARQEGRSEDEGWRVRKDGTRFWANAIITALRNRDGALRGFLKITRDVTDIEESRRLVQRIAEMMPHMLSVYDLHEKRNIFVNQRLELILGYSPADSKVPNAFLDHLHPEDRPKLNWAVEQYQVAEDDDVVELEYRMKHANGEWRWLHSRMMVFAREADGTPRQILGTTEDVTERKRLEQEVLEIAAKEQRRIGQELHDGTGQELTGLCMLSENLADVLREAAPGEELAARRITQGLRRALSQVRALSRGLIPVEVDAEGLMAALDELAQRISSLHGIRCVFECHEPVPVEDNYCATQLYRIAQEAITNALKHGQAKTIRVSLDTNGHGLSLKIADDGVGMARQNGGTEGMGLRIMRYRAGQIGARFSVRPTTSRGTMVTCMLVRGHTHD